MRTVLVSGASGIVGYGSLKALRQHPSGLRLIGTTIYEDSVAPAFCDVFERAPLTSDPGYLDWLTTVIRRHEVELLIPGIEADLYFWADHAAEIRAAGAQPVLNEPELIELCRDKWRFYERLRDAGLACAIPSTLEGSFESLSTAFGLPFLLKPRRGFASKGIARVADRAQFEPHAAELGRSLMAQPIVGQDDAEYTTSAFCDGQGGLSALMTLKRRLSRDGFTEKAEVVANDAFLETTLALCRLFRPIGPTNFQYRLCEDGPKLLEINPRVSSSTSIRTAFGYNECAMAVDFYLDGRLPQQPTIRGGRAVRYTEDCIFMKLAFISDIHGNYEALKQVLAAIDGMGVDQIYCAGDVVGYYAQINECCAELKARKIPTVMGNHDWYMAGGGFCPRSRSVNDCLVHQRRIIEPRHVEWLQSLPTQQRIGDLRIVHGGWADPIDEYLKPSDEYFDQVEGRYFVSGHTHIQLIHKSPTKTYCNPGSVGQPRDGDPRAAFATFDGTEFSLHRVEYDMQPVFDLMKAAGFDDYYYGGLKTGARNLRKL